MPIEIVPGRLLSWASDIDPKALQQAMTTARLPIVDGHVALMPDAHFGIGATVGSVIPTSDAIIPAAVGVDIGCGMIATEFDLTADDLPEDLDKLMPTIERDIPAGVGKGHTQSNEAHIGRIPNTEDVTPLTDKQIKTVITQFGTLGSGNHFVEICLDERDRVWTVLHSGSRGIGNQLAMMHIKIAKVLAERWHIVLEDKDLAYLISGTPEFKAYITDMLWAQRYAFGSRQVMADALNRALSKACGAEQPPVAQTINCHHNFTQMEQHRNRPLWITRKGAIKADKGDLGVIPGSMGAASYIVEGLGNTAAYHSCAHGAGRRMSRSQAKRDLTPDSLALAMAGRVWNNDRAASLVDEHPSAYKDIDQVMADQEDLVTVKHVLRQILNYKG